MNKQTQFLKNRNVWKRGLFMLLFIFLMGVTKFVTLVVVALQFLMVLFTGQYNDNLLQLGKTLSLYQYQILLFITYNSEFQPYPIGEWPSNTK